MLFFYGISCNLCFIWCYEVDKRLSWAITHINSREKTVMSHVWVQPTFMPNFGQWKEPEEMFGLSGLKNHLFSTLSLAFHLQSFQSWTSFKGKSRLYSFFFSNIWRHVIGFFSWDKREGLILFWKKLCSKSEHETEAKKKKLGIV